MSDCAMMCVFLARSSIGSISGLIPVCDIDQVQNKNHFFRALALNRPEISFAILGILGAIANGALFPVIISFSSIFQLAILAYLAGICLSIFSDCL